MTKFYKKYITINILKFKQTCDQQKMDLDDFKSKQFLLISRQVVT